MGAAFTTHADLARPPRQVFELISTPGRAGDWQTSHVGWARRPPARMGAGRRFTQKVTLMGVCGDVAWAVRRADAPRVLVLEGPGPLGITLLMSFVVDAADGGGSKLTVRGELRGPLLDGPMGEAVAAQAKAVMDESLERLGRLLGDARDRTAWVIDDLAERPAETMNRYALRRDHARARRGFAGNLPGFD